MDEQQVLGWLFTARDEASPVLESGQAAIEAAAGRIDDVLEDLVEEVDASTVTMQATLGAWASSALDVVMKPLEVVGGAVANLGKGLLSLPVTAVKQMGNAIQNLGQTAASAAVRVGEIVQNFISLDGLKKGLEAGGGLFGALLGPFGALLNLFSPLIDVLVEGLSPAMETFAAIFKTSFNELFELAEVLAQMFAPLLVEFMEPFVEIAEVIAVQAAGWLAGLVKGERASQGLASLFNSLSPVVMDIFRALGGLGREILPVVVDTFDKLAPITLEVVKEVGTLAAELLPEFGRIALEVIPPLVDAFAEVYKAILPIIPPLAELATVLIKDVFGPAVVAGAQWLAGWLKETFVPFIHEWMPAIIQLVQDLSAQVSTFYGSFSKNMGDLQVLVLDPISDWLTDLWQGMKDFAGAFKVVVIDPIWAAVQPFINQVTTAVQPLIDKVMVAFDALKSLTGLGDDTPVGGGAALTEAQATRGHEGTLSYEAAQAGMTIDEYLRARTANRGKKPGLAVGGIVDSPLDVTVGEAGPEAVIPLTAEKIQEVVGPIDFRIDGAREVVALVREIRDMLTKPLRLAGDGPGQQSGPDDVASLNGNVVGFSGSIG